MGNSEARLCSVPARHECVALAARPHVWIAFVQLESRVLLKQFGGGDLLDKIFTEVSTAYGTQTLQLPVINIHLNVPSHAVFANHPGKWRVTNTKWS
jgi:hypothetical protein